MTDREHRLRVRVDKLSDEREQLQGRVRALEARVGVNGGAHCKYCGVPVGSLRRTCVDHTDLVRLDPGMQR